MILSPYGALNYRLQRFYRGLLPPGPDAIFEEGVFDFRTEHIAMGATWSTVRLVQKSIAHSGQIFFLEKENFVTSFLSDLNQATLPTQQKFTQQIFRLIPEAIENLVQVFTHLFPHTEGPGARSPELWCT